MNYVFSTATFATLTETDTVDNIVSDTGQTSFVNPDYVFSAAAFSTLTETDVVDNIVSDTGQTSFVNPDYDFSGNAFNNLTLIASTINRGTAVSGFVSGG